MSAVLDHGPVLWRKSTRSGVAGDCVEVAFVSGDVAIRDSKDANGPSLSVSAKDWRLFLQQVRSGM